MNIHNYNTALLFFNSSIYTLSSSVPQTLCFKKKGCYIMSWYRKKKLSLKYSFRTESGKFKKINKMSKAMISITGLSTDINNKVFKT